MLQLKTNYFKYLFPQHFQLSLIPDPPIITASVVMQNSNQQELPDSSLVTQATNDNYVDEIDMEYGTYYCYNVLS